MPKSFFTQGLTVIAVAGIALGAAACGGDGAAKLYTTDEIGSAGGYYDAMYCGEGLQTVDVTVGSTSNSQGLKAEVKETNDEFGQVKVVVVASVPTDKELPLVIVHAIDDNSISGARDDRNLQPSVSAGGKLDSQLSTDQYAQFRTSGGRITGVTLCVRSVATTTS